VEKGLHADLRLLIKRLESAGAAEATAVAEHLDSLQACDGVFGETVTRDLVLASLTELRDYADEAIKALTSFGGVKTSRIGRSSRPQTTFA